MKASICRYILAVAVGFTLPTSLAFAGTRNVDCDAGGSIEKALRTGIGSADMLEIKLTGACYEDLAINRLRVRILGDGDASIVGNIRVLGPNDVLFRDLTITGPGGGLTVFNSRVRLIDVRITTNEGPGIMLDEGGAIRMTRGEVSANAGPGVFMTGSYAKLTDTRVIGNSGTGIGATGGSTLHIEGGAVSGNGVHGIDMMFSSSLSLWGTELSDNGIVEGYGAHFSHGSSGEIHFATITGNSGEGVEAFANSAIHINGGSIVGNDHHGVSLGLDSTADLVDVQILGNVGHGVFLWAASGLFIGGNSNIPPNNSSWSVGCDGKESSLMVDAPAYVPAIDCPDPEF